MTRLGGKNIEFDPSVISTITKTLIAMTNTKCGDCYVFVGIADKKEHADQHNIIFNSQYTTYKDFCITGVNAEASRFHGNLDKFIRKINQLIENEPVSAGFRMAMKSNILPFEYYGKDILVFKASRGEKPEPYGPDFYRRSVANNEKISIENVTDFIELFKKENAQK